MHQSVASLGYGFLKVFSPLVFGICPPSSCCVSFPFNDDLGTPPTWRAGVLHYTRYFGSSLDFQSKTLFR